MYCRMERLKPLEREGGKIELQVVREFNIYMKLREQLRKERRKGRVKELEL